jgi:hypothetical protein
MSEQQDKKRLPKISDEERLLMQKWLQKEHAGHNQLNARWIKGGGGVGVAMTDSKAVKTSGAYESLARYVNERLESKPQPQDDAYWTPKIASTRFAAAFKAYTEACKIGSKSDSAVGASEEEVNRQANYNAILLAQQVKKCPMFAVFHALYSEHPSVNPVMSVGMSRTEVTFGDIGADDGFHDNEVEEEDEVLLAPETPKSKNGSVRSDNVSDKTVKKNGVNTERGFKLKEGTKKGDFTTVWAATIAEAKDARLQFDIRKEERAAEERKRDREDKEKDRSLQEKKMKSDLMLSLLERGLSEDQISRYMRMVGFAGVD